MSYIFITDIIGLTSTTYSKATEFGEIKQNKGLLRVQAHSRSPRFWY